MDAAEIWRVRVLVDLPRHSRLPADLDYRCFGPLAAGTLLRVPLGSRTVMGVVWQDAGPEPVGAAPSGPDLRPVTEVLSDLPPLNPAWLKLIAFAASYYQRSLGELALSVLPPELKDLDGTQLARRLSKLRKALLKRPAQPAIPASTRPELSGAQAGVLAELAESGNVSTLLYGVTGSGKTEIYLREAERVLAAGQQVLMLVPEINLTPQLEARFAARFPQYRIVALHSGLTPAQRLQNWLSAHLGQADLVLGTRLAVFASLPRLGWIGVDEEHDPSYKQQDGARHSARDLAIWRARHEGVPVLLGSATPSLESWHNAHPQGDVPARHRLLSLPERIGAGPLPQVRLLDLKAVEARHGRQLLHQQAIAPELIDLIREHHARGEQTLVLLNRRGYAPVLHCTSCGWKSGCPHCTAWRVFHKSDRSLRCHHCGLSEPVMRACPECGDPDIQPLGRGTERLEEQLAALLPGLRIGRIDADSTRQVGSLERQLAEVHAGEIDVLIGTQMVAKGHDFRCITLVIALNSDGALFSSDFRAPERLFALLMQAAGRAGRDAAQAKRSVMWLQTWHPEHPLYRALMAHDYAAFAESMLAERQQAGLPPFVFLALLRVEARSQEAAISFLDAAAGAAQALLDAGEAGLVAEDLLLYPPVPAPMQRVAQVERAQMLIESPSRPKLQRFLARWLEALGQLDRPSGLLRWAVDIDPQSI